jgi:hypothetical protein
LDCALKAKLFEKGFGVFDVVGLSMDVWREVGVPCQRINELEIAMDWVRRSQRPVAVAQSSARAVDTIMRPPNPLQPQSGSAAVTIAADLVQNDAELSGKIRSMEPQQATASEGLCRHHGVPDRTVWKHEPLRPEELVSTTTKDGVWDVAKFTRVVTSMWSTIGVPREYANVWTIIAQPNFLWDGNREGVGRWTAYMWTTGKWEASRSTRCVQLGCLRCGYRTPLLFPYKDPVAQRQIAEVLDSLFER